MKIFTNLFLVLVLLLTGLVWAKPVQKNKLHYEKKPMDPALKEITLQEKADKRAREAVTAEISKKFKENKFQRKLMDTVLISDSTGIFPPQSPASCKFFFHFPPQAQYRTSTCWSYSATSFFESEIYRLTGKKIKLSEMWTPYFELIEKCRGYIATRGNSLVAGGGQTNGAIRIWKKYGVVPSSVYSGINGDSERHNHHPMMDELELYLDYIKENSLWDEESNTAQVVAILNKYMGRPPDKFEYNGKTMTPLEFLHTETGLNMEDYCSVMSTSRFPFYTRNEVLAPDNWWHNKDYINLPLQVWYNVIKQSILAGYTMVIGGDVSEPGKLGVKDIAFIPSFDIPQSYINQDSREYRIYNKSTEDDHGIHLVGYQKVKGRDWFLIKDSGRSAREGRYKGYYFFRDDFIRLKMLTFTVHKDMLRDILGKIK